MVLCALNNVPFRTPGRAHLAIVRRDQGKDQHIPRQPRQVKRMIPQAAFEDKAQALGNSPARFVSSIAANFYPARRELPKGKVGQELDGFSGIAAP